MIVTKLNRTIGLIGCGNMGAAILSGLLSKRMVSPGRVFVYDTARGKSATMRRKFRVRLAHDHSDLVRSVDVILLAVKPQDLAQAASRMKADLTARKTVVSILAGTPIRKLRQHLGSRASVVRAMPNLGAQVSEAMTAITSSNRTALAVAERIFLGCGRVVRLPERHFDLVTGLSGSGPAYFFLVMELLARIGERNGMSRKNAELLAVQTALGAARLAQVSPDSPARLRERVTSKKGTTEAALKFLADQGFANIFSRAVERAVARSRQLSHA